MPPGRRVQRIANCSSSATTHNMHSLKCVIIVIICAPNLHCQRWYSAGKREDISKDPSNDRDGYRNTAKMPNRSLYNNENIQITWIGSNTETFGEDPFLKLNSRKEQPSISDSIESKSSELNKTQDHYYKIVKNNSHKSINVINNNINLINLVKRKKLRHKITKRCPNKRVRYNRKLASNKTSARTKFLEVFEVIEFENIACTSSSGLEGICLHEYECQSSGGSTMGTCADGYGTCCVTQFSCDGQSSESIGWFTNPGFPSPSTDRISCTFTLNKSSEDIQQIRLDLVTFELLAPNAGTCQQDQFVVSGQNMNSIIPILCGINTGQHVYVEVGDIEGPIYLSIQTVSPESRLYSIKVTQLTSADDLAAPFGCLQYFTEEQGILESFNYRDKSDIGIPRVPSYLNNLNYAMCIRRAPETCSVTYSKADYMQIVNFDLDGLPVIPQGQAGVEIFNCPGDWLLISATRLCGDRLNDGAVLQDFSLDAPITDSNAGPIAVWFRTDEGYAGRGFKLQYQQNPCNGPL